jgi:hypothetical protein
MPRTPKQVISEQKAQAERDLASKKQAVVSAKTTLLSVLSDDGRSPEDRYLDTVAPSGIAGRWVRYTKDGKFVFADTGEVISESEDFTALCDETLISWVKFNDDNPPTRVGGLLFRGFVLPHRTDLGDPDEADWPIGLSGRPEDPWKHEMLLVLRRPKSLELCTFSTMSKTGRRAVGTLLRHYQRLRADHPGAYPVIRLKSGGYTDKRYGFVPTPNFVPVGMTSGHSAAIPDTSLGAQLNDSINF